ENLVNGEEIKDTVKVIGKAVIGEDGLWGFINNAAEKVFNPEPAEKSVEADEKTEADTDAETETKESASPEGYNPESLPTITPNVFDEISPDSTGDNMSAGAFLVNHLVYRKSDEIKENNAESYAKYGSGIPEAPLPEGSILLIKPAQKAENKLAEKTASKLPLKYTAPLKGVVTSAFGDRTDPLTYGDTFHHGIDVGAPKGTAVKAFASGKVTETGISRVYGKYIRIDHGLGYSTFYGHLSKISIKKGKIVKLGQKIGEVGSTGRSTGPHLHFELRFNGNIMNPSVYVSFA
ncbi:MAG: M23 family metallopeptidase, partial [Bacillota bacterium]|nr:M23 family metallopeptidase [Bacillota bacterium]